MILRQQCIRFTAKNFQSRIFPCVACRKKRKEKIKKKKRLDAKQHFLNLLESTTLFTVKCCQIYIIINRLYLFLFIFSVPLLRSFTFYSALTFNFYFNAYFKKFLLYLVKMEVITVMCFLFKIIYFVFFSLKIRFFFFFFCLLRYKSFDCLFLSLEEVRKVKMKHICVLEVNELYGQELNDFHGRIFI